jgi:hypothetical protein
MIAMPFFRSIYFNSQFSILHSQLSFYLYRDFGDAVFVFPGSALKRESGANPEQTRCCKLRQSL